MNISNEERRSHIRHSLRAFAAIGDSSHEWAAHVLDISLHGARVALLDKHHFSQGDTVQLKIEVPQVHIDLGMPPYLYLHGTLVHCHASMLGIRYEPETPDDAELLTLLINNFI